MTTPCQEFQGCRDKDGYGLIRRDGKMRLAHRVAMADALGIPLTELRGWVLHRCDNPPCRNVEHLFIGTHAENMQDMVAKARRAGGTRNGKLTVAQVEEIIARYSLGIETQKDLARAFGVAQSQISYIVRRIQWKVLA